MFPTLKEIVKDNKVYFSHYRANYLYYTVKVEEKTYMFVVPVEDIGGATFMSEDKAIYFMIYIKKSLEDDSFVFYK